MMVLSEALRSNSGLAAPIQKQFGQQFVQQWFPTLDQQRKYPGGVVAYAQMWLSNVGSELSQWGGDLHFASQSLCYHRLVQPVKLVPLSQWQDHVKTVTGKHVPKKNIGHYVVAPHRFVTLRPLVEQMWAEDFVLWRQVGLNTR
jgi:hypothetical protein